MKHRVFGKKLNRDSKERKALFKSLVKALVTHGKIKTTFAKAKAIQGLADKLVTKAKDGSNVALRQLSSVLNNKESINKLVKEIAPRFKDKLGGYIRIIKLGKRKSDATEEVIMEWSIAEKKAEPKINKENINKNIKKTDK